MFENWTPKDEDYTPGITTDKWIEILSNEEITSPKYLEILAKIRDYGEEFSCSDLADKYGRNQQYYSKNIWEDYAHKLEAYATNGLFQTVKKGDRWWPIMFYCRSSKESEKGSYMFKFRSEFKEALDRIGISKYLKKDNLFTWIPFYKEMGDLLINYKSRRSELLDILYQSLNDSGLSDSMYVKNDEKEKLTNIDPLTFIGSFNRGNKLEDRIKLANSIAQKLGMNLRLSEDEELLSIPILNSQHSTLFFRNCPESDYDKLWNLFEAALKFDDDTKDTYSKAYDAALTVKGTGQKYATMSCYWVNPYNLVSLDENNRDLFNKYGIQLKRNITGSDYLEILKTLEEKLNSDEIEEKSIPEFSYNAWKMEKQDFWACGFKFGSDEDQYARFIKEKIWEGRFNKDKDAKQIKRVEKVRTGNVIVLKTSYTKGSGHNIPATKVYAVGIVKAVSEPEEIGNNYLSYVFDMDYIEVNPPKEIENLGAYRETITPMKDDVLKTFSRNILGNKNISLESIIYDYKRLLKKTKNTQFIDDEVDKWDLITLCENKSAIEIVEHLIKINSNLIDTPRVLPGWKEILKDNKSGFEVVLNNLLNENINIHDRLGSFNSEMENLFKVYPNYKNFANDERTASVILGCKYPNKYIFYKDIDVYDSLCNRLAIEKKKAGEKFEHYMSIINQLAGIVSEDDELQEIIKSKTKDKKQSNLLIAQTAVYCVFSKNGQSMLEEEEIIMQPSIPENIIEYTNLLKNKKNVILQGAPGTGKTYTTASLALSICGIQDIDYNDRKAVKAKYEELRKSGQIGFCTFHQSMDYEDFVEGLRPEPTGNGVVYNPVDGLFKRICLEARKNYEDSTKDDTQLGVEESFDKAWDNFISDLSKTGEILKLKTPTDSDFAVSLNSKGNLSLLTGKDFTQQGVLTKGRVFNQFINGEKYWAGYYQGVIDKLVEKYGLNNSAADENVSDKKILKNYVLIIDEINRGFISKILGELITLLEADKRLGEEATQLTVELPYSGETFGVPKNLYIIGTMNTTDRSTGTIDYAVRRRFGFITIEADKSFLIDNNCLQESINLFDDVKKFIEEKKLEDIDIGDLMVGHSYFMAKDKDILKQKIRYEVIPLIKEYIKDGILTCLTSEAKEYFDDWLELNVHTENMSESIEDEESEN